MGDRFPAVEEKRDLAAGENAPHRFVVRIERARQHRAVAVAPALADMLADEAGRQDDFFFGMRTSHEADVGLPLRQRQRQRARPMSLQMREDWVMCKAPRASLARK